MYPVDARSSPRPLRRPCAAVGGVRRSARAVHRCQDCLPEFPRHGSAAVAWGRECRWAWLTWCRSRRRFGQGGALMPGALRSLRTRLLCWRSPLRPSPWRCRCRRRIRARIGALLGCLAGVGGRERCAEQLDEIRRRMRERPAFRGGCSVRNATHLRGGSSGDVNGD